MEIDHKSFGHNVLSTSDKLRDFKSETLCKQWSCYKKDQGEDKIQNILNFHVDARPGTCASGGFDSPNG